jgi:hypothetical protein
MLRNRLAVRPSCGHFSFKERTNEVRYEWLQFATPTRELMCFNKVRCYLGKHYYYWDYDHNYLGWWSWRSPNVYFGMPLKKPPIKNKVIGQIRAIRTRAGLKLIIQLFTNPLNVQICPGPLQMIFPRNSGDFPPEHFLSSAESSSSRWSQCSHGSLVSIYLLFNQFYRTTVIPLDVKGHPYWYFTISKFSKFSKKQSHRIHVWYIC